MQGPQSPHPCPFIILKAKRGESGKKTFSIHFLRIWRARSPGWSSKGFERVRTPGHFLLYFLTVWGYGRVRTEFEPSPNAVPNIVIRRDFAQKKSPKE